MSDRPARTIAASGAAADAAVRDAATVLASGGIIAYPTETFYGLGGDPAREDAVAAIFAAKGRSAGEALPLIAADATAARSVAASWNALAEGLAAAFWPGPLTLVLRVRAGAVVDGVTAGRDTVAVRVPGHPLARALAGAAPGGLLTSTSANRSGSPALATADAVAQAIGAHVSLIVDGGPSPGGLASTIVDVTGERPRLIRDGAVAFDRVLEFLR